MQRLASALTPSEHAPPGRKRRRKAPKAQIERLSHLNATARDLWTATPLEGADLEDWLKLRASAGGANRGTLVDEPPHRIPQCG
jgi:hypothetical protein